MNSFVSPQMLIPIIVGVTVSVGVLGLFLLFGRSKDTYRRRPRDFQSELLNRSSDWELPNTSFSNRRSSVRREGKPVKVLLSSPTFKTGTATGYVVDRSMGGLRIVMQMGMSVGSTIMVRTTNAPDTIPWVTVSIRSCRPNGKLYEHGCEFDKTPPWSVLLLFG